MEIGAPAAPKPPLNPPAALPTLFPYSSGAVYVGTLPYSGAALPEFPESSETPEGADTALSTALYFEFALAATIRVRVLGRGSGSGQRRVGLGLDFGPVRVRVG